MLNEKRFTFYLLAMLILSSCSREPAGTAPVISEEENEEHKDLKQHFRNWQKNEIANRHMWASDSCSMEWFMKNSDNSEGDIAWGFPDHASEYHYSYADLNNDGELDQLVTFTPNQCDGGNASMWTQIQVLTVSKNGTFETTSSIGDGLFTSLGKDSSGFYWYDSIGVNRIYGTFFNFNEGDGHCCPGIQRPVIFDYETKELIHLGDNIAGE